MSVLSFVDVLMVGQLGEAVVAGVGIGNQINFIRIILSFGISLGVGVFAAQYWGPGDIESLHSYQGIGLIVSIIVGILFPVLSIFFPNRIVFLYSNDPEVVRIGSEYIRIIGTAFIFNSITIIFAQTLRSTENVKIPLLSSIIGFGLNTLLNYLLIFGKFGFPEMGFIGAAVATVIARCIEFLFLLIITYAKKLPTASSLGQLMHWNLKMIKRFIKIGGPIILHNGFWIIGTNIYAMVFGRPLFVMMYNLSDTGIF